MEMRRAVHTSLSPGLSVSEKLCVKLRAEHRVHDPFHGSMILVKLSEGIAPSAGLQNRACHFYSTRLLMRVGWWEFSARLLRERCWRWFTPGRISRLAAA